MADVGAFQTLAEDVGEGFSENSIRVLFVDGRDAARSPDQLERANSALEVVTETTVRDALSRLNDSSIDCIVSTYDLPGLTGLAFLRAVRETRPDLPFVLRAVSGDETVASRAISANVTDYLRHDVPLSQLADRIVDFVTAFWSERQVKRGFAAMDTAREGISILDDEGQFVYVNEQYADLLGYDAQDLVGEHWRVLYPDEAVDYIENEVLPAVPVKGRWTGETVYVRKSGERILVDHALTYTDKGDLICLIEDQETTERPLVAETTFVQHTLDAIDDVFYVVNNDLELVRVNEHATDVTGYTETELTSMNTLRLFPEADRDRVRAAAQEIIDTGSVELEVDLVTRDGKRIPYEFKNQRLTNADGTTIGFVGIGRDISDRTRIETELRETHTARQRFYDITAADDLSFDEKIQRILDVGRDRLDLSLGIVTKIADGTQHIEAARGDHPDLQAGAACPLSEAYCRRTIETDGHLSVQDATVEFPPDDPGYERFGLGTYIGAKVVVDGDLYGTLCFADDDARDDPFTDAEHSLVELLARWLGHRLARERDTDRFDETADLVADDLLPLLDQLETQLDQAPNGAEGDVLDAVQDTCDDLTAVAAEIDNLVRVDQG